MINADAQTFYSKSTGAPNLVATWGQNTDGTGTAPPNFTTNGQIFILTNGNAIAQSANWTISGTGSKLVVGEGIIAQTFATSTFTFAGTVDVANLGVFNVQSNSTFTLGTCATGSTVNYALDNAQGIMTGTYYHLTLSNATSARTKTATGAITVNGDLNVTTNNTFVLTTFQLSGVNGLISGNGTITTTNTSAAPIPAGKIWSQNITYTSTSSQTVVKGVYNLALNVAGAVGSRVFPSNGDTVEVKGTFTASSASVTYTTTGTRFIFSGGAQTLTFSTTSAFNFGNVLFSGTSVAKTIATAGFNADTLNVAPSVTLTMATFALGGTLSSISGAGIISTGYLASTPLPAGKIWTQTVNYSGATQTIVAGTYPNLIIAAGAKTASGDIVVNTLLTSTGNLDMGTNVLSGTFTNSGAGLITTANASTTPIPAGKTWSQAISYNSSSNQTVVKGVYVGALTITGTTASATRTFPTNGDTVEVRAAFNAANVSGVNYNAADARFLFTTASKTITFNVGSTFHFGYVVFSGSTFINTIAGNGFTADTLNVGTGATLNMATFALGGSLNNIAGLGTIQTQNTTATPLSSGRLWSQNITYNATGSQTVVHGIYTLALNIAGGNRTFSNVGVVDVRGAFTANTAGAVYTTTGSSVVFSTAAQTLTFGTSTINFSNISFTGASVIKTIAGGGFNADTLNVAATVTLNMATFALGGTLSSTIGTGTIQTQNISSTPIPAGKIWPQNITYNATGSQSVVKGIYTAALNVSGGIRVFPNAGDTIEVRGNFTANTASTTYTTTGTRFVFSNNAQTLTFGTTVFNFGYVSFTGAGITKTIAGAGFNVDTLNITSTTTLNMVTFALGGNVLLTTGTGTLTTQATATGIPLGKVWSPLVNYNADAAQAIIGGTYENLTISVVATARTKTATGSITVNNQLQVLSTGAGVLTFSMSSFQLINGPSFVLSNSGTSAKNITTNYANTDTAFKPLPINQTWPGTVTYSSASHQTVVSGVYPSIAVIGGPRTFSAIGTIEIQGAFSPSTASTTYTCTGSSFVFSGGAQTLTFVASSVFNFNNVSFKGANSTKTIAGAGFGINGVLNIDTTCTLNMVTFAITGNLTATTGSGMIATQNVTTPLPPGETWSQTVNYNSTAAHNISGGRYANLILFLSGTSARTKTAIDSITVDRTLTFQSTGTGVITLAMGVYRLIDGGNLTIVNSGSALKNVTTNCTNTDTTYKPLPSNKTWPGAVTYGSASHQTVVAGYYTSTLSVNGGPRTFSAMGTIELAGAFTASSTSVVYNVTGTNFLFSGGAQTLTFATTSPVNFNNISFTGTNAIKTIAGAAMSVNGVLNVGSTVTLNMATFALTGSLATISGNGIITTQCLTAALPLGKVWSQTVNYNVSTNQNIIGGTYQKLMITAVAAARTKTATGNIQVNDSFTLSTTGTGTISLQMVTYNLINGGAFKLINSGGTARNINTQSVAALPLPSGLTWPVLGTITYDAASGTQTISKGVYTNLTLSGNAAKVAEGNFTVRGTLTLTTPNPSITRGCLHMGSDTLTMDTGVATIAGTGDVSGITRRRGLLSAGVAYKFGNTYTQIILANGGIVPSEINMRTRLGDSLSWKGSGVRRQYEIAQTGGSGTATIQFRYLATELNGNIETRLVVWEDSSGTVLERGRSAINTTNKFVEVSNIPLSNYSSTFGGTKTGMSRTELPEVNWVGVTSNAWATATNWDPTFVPDSTDDVIIPDASTTLNDPVLPATARVKTIAIETNGILTGATGAQLTIYGGTTVGLSSWDCNGTFTPSTSNITFLGSDATYSGTANFYDVTISTGAVLSNRESSIMRIGNSIVNAGIWRVAAFNETTVEYNKAGSQTILRPNGISVSGYYNLIVNGSGTKTFPDSLDIKGDLTSNGTVVINSLRFNGNTDQYFSSNNPVTLNKLTINNGHELFLGNTISIIDSLNLTSGILNLSNNDIGIGGYLSGTGSISSTSLSDFLITGTGAMGVIRFTDEKDSVGNMSMNRSGTGGVILGSPLIVTGNLMLTNGSMQLAANELLLGGNFTGSALGNISGNGTTSALFITGSGILDSLFFDQTIPGTTNRISRLMYNRSGQSIKLANALEVVDSIVPIAGVLSSAGNLTLVSGALKTARIADGNCSTCSYITGNVKVQRHIPAFGRRWRFLGSPVSGNTITDWQNEIFITGPGGVVNGFDSTLSNFPGIYSYNESVITGNLNTGYTIPANTSQPIGVGRGYRIFIRGDRSDLGRLNGTVSTQNAVTVDAVGVPNQGDIVMPVTCTFSTPGPLFNDSNDGWNLLANPYASAYDWDAHYNSGLYQNNIDPTIWLFNSVANGYVSYNASSRDGDLTDGIIPSGASFWVKANGANPTLTFKERFKAAVVQPVGLFKTDDGESFKITLLQDTLNSDAAIVKYVENANEHFDHMDTRKLAGTITLSVYGYDSVQLALSVRPTTFELDTIKLNVSGNAGNYTLRFTNSDKIAIKDKVLLFDTYLTTVTDLQVTHEYPFSMVSGIRASGGPGRFYIIVGNVSSLPVSMLHFSARKTEGAHQQVSLRWSTAQEINNDKFRIERSGDGEKFETIGEISGHKLVSGISNYAMEDYDPQRKNYYRLTQVDMDGTIHHLAVRVVNFDEKGDAEHLVLYPLPAKETLTIKHKNTINTIQVVDLFGNEVYKASGNNKVETINIAHLSSGIYVLIVSDDQGNRITEKFVKR